MDHESVCYFLFDTDRQWWKIGKTSNVITRMSTLMKERPSVLHAVFWEEAHSERKCLKVFAALRVNRKEWFSDDPSIRQFITDNQEGNLLRTPAGNHLDIQDFAPELFRPRLRFHYDEKSVDPIFCSCEELAARLGGVTVEELQGLAGEGKIPCWRLSPRSQLLFKKREALEAFTKLLLPAFTKGEEDAKPK